MKAFDGFLEKPMRESGFDSRSGRGLSREIDDILRKHFEKKQEISVASNYFAMACPIMPAFLLGAFMLLDKLDDMAEKDLIKSHEFVRSREGLAQHLYIVAMREKMEAEAKKQGLACSRPLEGLPPIGSDKNKKIKKKENELLMDGKATPRLNGPVLLSKAQTDVHKIVKKKMALESHLEELSKEQDFGATCRVASQLELLDKKLKQLGC